MAGRVCSDGELERKEYDLRRLLNVLRDPVGHRTGQSTFVCANEEYLRLSELCCNVCLLYSISKYNSVVGILFVSHAS